MNALLEWLQSDVYAPHWAWIAWGVPTGVFLVLWWRASGRADVYARMFRDVQLERDAWEECAASASLDLRLREAATPAWMEQHREQFFAKAELSAGIKSCLEDFGYVSELDLPARLAEALIERHAQRQEASKSHEGEAWKAKRIAAGFGLREFAEAIAVLPSIWFRFENGTFPLHDDAKQRASSFLRSREASK